MSSIEQQNPTPQEEQVEHCLVTTTHDNTHNDAELNSSEIKGSSSTTLDSEQATTDVEAQVVAPTQSSLDEVTSNNSMETLAAETSSMLTNVPTSSASESLAEISCTTSMEEEEAVSDASMVAEVVPTPTGKGYASLFETCETPKESPNKRVREVDQDDSEETNDNTQEVAAEEFSTQLEEPQAKKVKSNEIESSMISDTATDGSANTSSVTICCEEDDEIEVTLVYEDKERALSFYKTVFEVEVVNQPEETETKPAEEGNSVENGQSTTFVEQEPDDVKIKGFKLNAKLSPKKKVQQSSLPKTPRIFIPSEKLQSTLERVKGFEGACVEECLDFTCITCPEGNKLTLVKIDV
ncbi:predicted protein [Naegleria gruberi]|uniref:Predicted protein n=1 Tax=Naegleria gruberi TaxID=5762 RepID=D2VEX8_NAEGR|nr:uncharacterized protein NAEGRDRAFT_48983 [Naegleria gruberi]EFC44585.1 predicted protein [Naegleria gruberi]|eukprot:XP_002677329.1 predicted protein [Naegleria gruberi strain NEG-M]